MTPNPLFPTENDDDKKDNAYLLSGKRERKIAPVSDPAAKLHDGSVKSVHATAAANIIRNKLDKLYTAEPDAKQEIAEDKTETVRSKHQDFMHKLSTSGKGLAEIQTEWHNYYLALPDEQKHEVWQEFYAANSTQTSHYQQHVQAQQPVAAQTTEPVAAANGVVSSSEFEQLALDTPVHKIRKTIDKQHKAATAKLKTANRDKQKADAIKRQVLDRITAKGQLRAKHHLQSLLFGLGVGATVLFIFLFGFFNQIIIAPFIQPSRQVSATPIIIGTDSVAPTSQPEVIIPKINVEIPLVGFDLTTTNEAAVETDLQDGVTHYPTTVLPGQKGNTAFFGHSSNNIFNPGHYKFAFTLLHELVPGDTFYLTYNHKVYAYQVYQKKIVSPSDVSVLDSVAGKTATAALITCDPPGTSINRLVVWGEQVSPNPDGNTATAAPQATATAPTTIVGNGPSLWSRLVSGVTGLF